MTEFVTSDIHFFHHNIIKFCNRPWQTVDEMNLGLVRNWNEVVEPQDIVWVLGDVSFGKPGPTLEVMAELNGNIRLIPGNHDRKGVCIAEDLRARCTLYPEYHLHRLNKDQKFVMCHFPFAQWERGWVNLHGHTHGTYRSKFRQYDVGVDNNNWRPITLVEAYDKAISNPPNYFGGNPT